MWLTVFQIVSLILCWIGIVANIVGIIWLHRARKILLKEWASLRELAQGLTKTE